MANIFKVLSNDPVPEAPFMEKMKSKKFLFVVAWSLFTVWGFIVMFWTKAEVPWFKELLDYGFWISTVYLATQSVVDLNKPDDSFSFKSRKSIVTIIQIIFLLTGFALSFYLTRVTPGFTSLSFMNSLIANCGGAILSILAVNWTLKDGKIVPGTAKDAVKPLEGSSPTEETTK